MKNIFERRLFITALPYGEGGPSKTVGEVLLTLRLR